MTRSNALALSDTVLGNLLKRCFSLARGFSNDFLIHKLSNLRLSLHCLLRALRESFAELLQHFRRFCCILIVSG